MLLYLQEVAVNKILTQAEWDSLPSGVLDQGVVSTTLSVCQPALLHCMSVNNLTWFTINCFSSGTTRSSSASSPSGWGNI